MSRTVQSASCVLPKQLPGTATMEVVQSAEQFFDPVVEDRCLSFATYPCWIYSPLVVKEVHILNSEDAPAGTERRAEIEVGSKRFFVFI